jgi:NAD(P)-dependent dehydrogenase (short-subunit alcohol dehydrogenase family)
MFGRRLKVERKVAFVTGASRGIGRAIALKLAREGCDVAFHYRTGQVEAEAGAEEAEAMGVRAFAVGGDVSRSEDVASCFQEVERELGLPYLLINNAGMAVDAPKFEDATEEVWDRIMNVNLKSQFLCVHEAVPRMRQLGSGVIINIGSELAFRQIPQSLPYHVAAIGVVMMTQWLARHLAPEIRVNCVAPGATTTGIGGGIMLDKEYIAQVAHRTPLGRIGEPEDTAELVAFLASDRANYVTGQTCLVNGGHVCH